MPFAGLGTAAISGGASLISGLIGGKGAAKAAKTLSNAGNAAATATTGAANQGQTAINSAAGQSAQGVTNAAGTANSGLASTLAGEQANLNPYLAAGQQGVTSLSSALAPGGSLSGTFAPPNPQDISSTPEYQFQLQQGLQALTRAAAATGGVQGGGTLKGITQYGQGLASTSYQQAYNNALNTYQTNRSNTLQGLTTLTGLGQTATGQYNSAAQNAGNLSSGNITNAAQLAGGYGLQGATSGAQLNLTGVEQAGQQALQGAGGAAAGQVGQANAFNSALGGIANAANGYVNYPRVGGATNLGSLGIGGVPEGGYSVGTTYQPPPVVGGIG